MKAWVFAIAAVPAIARGDSRCLEMPPVLHAVKGASVLCVDAPKVANGTPKLKFVHIRGNAVFGKWLCYDVPCGMPESLIGAKGEVLGETWPAGKEIVLDKAHVAVLSEYPNTGTFTVVDTK